MRIFQLYLSLLRENFQERKKNCGTRVAFLPTKRQSWTVSSVKCKWKSIFWQRNRMNCQIQWSPNVTGPIKISVVHISTNFLIIRSGWLITVCLWVGISIILLLFHRVAKNIVVGSKTKSTCPSLPFHGIFICIHLLKMSSGKRRNDNCRTLNIIFFLEGVGGLPLDSPSLKRLRRSNFSFRAYTFQISRYAPENVRYFNFAFC